MDIIKVIFNILKNINFRYEKNADNHTIDLNIDGDSDIKGSLSIKSDKDNGTNISAHMGDNNESNYKKDF
jgi:hypothetical protein